MVQLGEANWVESPPSCEDSYEEGPSESKSYKICSGIELLIALRLRSAVMGGAQNVRSRDKEFNDVKLRTADRMLPTLNCGSQSQRVVE